LDIFMVCKIAYTEGTIESSKDILSDVDYS
jgi:hypothetical protein